MKDLEKIRKKIDRVDERIIDLLNQRASLAMEIAKLKRKTGSPVYLPARENDILRKVEKKNSGPLPGEALQNVFREIFSATRSVEKEIKVASLGPAGSFSHLAAVRLFGSSLRHVLEPGMDVVFSDVVKGKTDFGVVPVENSIEGEVGQTLDLLMDSPVNIYGELFYRVSQNLLSKSRSLKGIKTLYSHDMPLRQCRQWVARELPGVKIVETSSSSEAARRAARSKTAAAIGAAEAAEIYGLSILAERIEDRPGNQTRFFIISRTKAPRSGNDKTSIILSIKDEPGALGRILRPFAARGLNLSKIQSRLSRERRWKYVFFIDFEGHEDDRKTKDVLKKLESQAVFLKVLGSYPKARARD